MKSSNATSSTVHLFGNLLKFILCPAETGDSFSLVECRTAPKAGAPPNRHSENEAFYILEGTVEFTVGETSSIHMAGNFVPIPNNVVHTFRNVGPDPSRMLIMNWPGHDHVNFFREVGEPVPDSIMEFPDIAEPSNPDAIAAVALKHNIIFQ